MKSSRKTSSDSLKALKTRCERLELLYQVSNVIHSTLDPQEALQLIVNEAVRVMKASSGSVVMINPNTALLEIHASSGLPQRGAAVRLRLGKGITGWVASNGRAARVNDVTKDSRYVQVRPGVRSELAVPLEVIGETRGVINVDSDRVDAFTAEDEALLVELASQAAKVIQNTWLYEQLRLKARLFETLANVAQTINSTINLNDALHAITREACALIQARMSSLMLLDAPRKTLELQASHGAGHAYKNKPALDVDESLLGVVVRRKRPLQIENVQTSGRYHYVEVAREEGLVSLLSVPLLFGGDAIGTLNVYMGVPYNFSNEEIRILSALAQLSAIAIEKARLYERIVDVEEQLRRNEKLSALGLLAAEVAHEIRNPLTVMKMLYHSLNLDFQEGDPRAKDARIIGEKMEHLNRIVEQILDLSRSSEPHMAQVDVNALIEELGLLVRHKLRNQGVEFVRQLDPQLPAITGDATQLEQAFLNLILNAAEAMPNGGTLTILTSVIGISNVRSSGTCVHVEVQDTGHGMREEERLRAFTSLLDSNKARGSGLGLAIVARVVEGHGGSVEIHSQVNIGTTMIVLLPVR